MAGVVHELEVDVRVVDGRVAAERIVGDVERVVRARGDLEPRFVDRVEDRRRDLADTAAKAGLDFAVDDHRRHEEALVGSAGAPREPLAAGRAPGGGLNHHSFPGAINWSSIRGETPSTLWIRFATPPK